LAAQPIIADSKKDEKKRLTELSIRKGEQIQKELELASQRIMLQRDKSKQELY
jgi:F0F1-type ATP synthase membrane subunit b/b'